MGVGRDIACILSLSGSLALGHMMAPGCRGVVVQYEHDAPRPRVHAAPHQAAATNAEATQVVKESAAETRVEAMRAEVRALKEELRMTDERVVQTEVQSLCVI